MSGKNIISIIIPIYNVQKLLDRCIESVVCQTYSNLEIILVDDGSSDNSYHVCESYGQKDERIKILKQVNSGASSARNKGLAVAVGEYVCFIDSDDYVEKEYLSSFLVPGLYMNESLLVIQDIRCIAGTSSFLLSYVRSGTGIADAFYGGQIIQYGFPVGKLFNRRIIQENSLSFNVNIHYSEDMVFLLSYINCIEEVYFTCSSCYNYMIDNVGSLSKKYQAYESEILCFTLARGYYDLIAKNHAFPELKIAEDYSILVKFLVRSIKAMYRIDNLMNLENRIKTLKKHIGNGDMQLVINHFIPELWLDKVLIILLRTNRVGVIDLYLRFIFLLRYRFFFFWKNIRGFIK